MVDDDALVAPNPHAANELATAVGTLFSAPAARLVLLAIADGDHPLAPLVGANLDTLVPLAAASVEATSGREAATDEDVDNATEAPVETVTATSVQAVEQALEKVEQLVVAAAEVAATLRRTADEVSAYRPVTSPLLSAFAWSTSASDLLRRYHDIEPCDDLLQLQQHLHDQVQARVQRHSQLDEAARAIRSLREQGLDRYIPTVLLQEGSPRWRSLRPRSPLRD